ncbi:MAG: hypothetical protein MJH10_04060 [Epibacterium sp.]|nr:hypothetical protein [Epibacterium sp.]NQX72726.1 hypothetical protein [Epibacterium sp.]
MAFNLPAAQYLMRTNSSSNRGSFDSAFQTGQKTGGNLPITFVAAQVQNGGGNEGIYFGMDAQNSTSGKDASTNTKVVLTSVQFNAPNRIQVGTLAQRGVVARLTSGAGGSNYREYRIGGNDTPFAASQAGPVTICLDLSANGEDDSGGSYDNSNVTGWGYGTFKTNLAGGSSNLNFFQRVFLFDTGKGEPNLPTFTGVSNFDDAIAVVQGDGYTTKLGAWLTKSGSSFFIPAPFSFGDGSSPVTFDDQGAAVVSPFDNAAGQENFRLTNDAMRVYLDTRDNAADSVTLSGSYAWGTAAPWDFSQSNAGTCTLSGNFNGMGEFSLGSSVTANGTFNLASGEAVVSEGANINGITVRGDLNLVGSSVTALQNVTVDGALDFDTAGTYTLTSCNIEEVTNSSGGTVIINNAGSTINTNTGPNISIIAPPATLTLNGLQADSEVRVYEAGTFTEIDGVENSGTSFSTSVTVPSVDIVIFSLQYLPIKLFAIDTTSNVALPISQQFDRNYNNP